MNWLGRFLHKSRAESELDKELRFHLEQQIADGVAKGLRSPRDRRPRSRCLVREVFLVADALICCRRVFCWKILVD